MNSSASKKIVLALLCVAAFAALAQGQSSDKAILYSSGVVMVNGRVVPSTTAVFKGDVLQTTNGANALLVSPGARVSIPEGSRVQFQGKTIQVTSGAASVSTSSGVALHANQYSVTPASPTGTYAVAVSDKGLKVASQIGTVNVSGGSEAFSVASGTSRSMGDTKSLSSVASPNTQADALTVMSPGLDTIIPITGVCPSTVHCGFH